MLSVGTYRTAQGGLLHRRLDAAGHVRCEIERDDGSLCEVDEERAVVTVLLSRDPDWPGDVARVAALMDAD